MTQPLKPCPFCGTNFQEVMGEDSGSLRLCRVVCNECEYGGPNYRKRDEAVAWWNKRAAESE
jgi:Lar family restriction alleviation protein